MKVTKRKIAAVNAIIQSCKLTYPMCAGEVQFGGGRSLLTDIWLSATRRQ